jgi:hypothetical protein
MPKVANYDRIPEPKPSTIIMTPLDYDKATESALYCWFSALLVIESNKKSITKQVVLQISIIGFYYSKSCKYCNAVQTTRKLTTPLQYDAAFIRLEPCLSIIPRCFALLSFHLLSSPPFRTVGKSWTQGPGPRQFWKGCRHASSYSCCSTPWV